MRLAEMVPGALLACVVLTLLPDDARAAALGRVAAAAVSGQAQAHLRHVDTALLPSRLDEHAAVLAHIRGAESAAADSSDGGGDSALDKATYAVEDLTGIDMNGDGRIGGKRKAEETAGAKKKEEHETAKEKHEEKDASSKESAAEEKESAKAKVASAQEDSDCSPKFDASPDGVRDCSEAVCVTQRRIDVEPTDPEDYNDLHMQMGGRSCVPKDCTDGEDLSKVAVLMWKRERALSKSDFSGGGRTVDVAVELDCTQAQGAAVSVDKTGTAEIMAGRPAAEKAAVDTTPRSAAVCRRPFLGGGVLLLAMAFVVSHSSTCL